MEADMAGKIAEQTLELHKFIKDIWPELNTHYPIQQWVGPHDVRRAIFRHGFEIDLETVVEVLLRLYREGYLVIQGFECVDQNGHEYCELTFARPVPSS